MKKLGSLAVALTLSAAVFAQTTTPATTTQTNPVPGQMKDMRHDIRDYNKDKAAAARDIKTGHDAAAQKQLNDAQADRADINKDAATLKTEGVKHPIARADKQIKKADEKDIRKDAKDIRTDKKDAAKDAQAGNLADAKKDVADIKADKKDMRKDIRQAKRDGIKHPVKRAH